MTTQPTDVCSRPEDKILSVKEYSEWTVADKKYKIAEERRMILEARVNR